MSNVLLRSKVFHSGLSVFKLPRCGLKLKADGVEYYWKDFPYEEGVIPSVFDRAYFRKNENAKSIAVEGNIAVGKEKFARNFAALCDLKFVEGVTDDDIFIDRNFKPPIDYRDYNPILPKRFQFYTTEMLYSEPDPINEGKPLYTQQSYYIQRYYSWWKHCAHVFHTGQGFVTKRSPFSTYIFARALAETGRLSAEARDWFDYYERNLSPTLFHPHLFVYLRSPISLSRDNLNARAVPWEKNISDEFLQVVKQVYESEFLPRMQRHSEIFLIDVEDYDFDDANDMQYLVEEMCKLDLDQKHLARDIDTKLLQWRRAFYNHDSMQIAREYFTTAKECLKNLKALQVPEEIKEGGLSIVELQKLRALLKRDPRIQEWSQLNPWDGRSALKLAVGTGFNTDPSVAKGTYDEDLTKLFALERMEPIIANVISNYEPNAKYKL